MKIAFTTSGDNLDAALDERFGRAKKFLIYETDDGSFIVLDNQQNLNAAQGAGTQSAQSVIRSGAKVVITGNCGPKAFRALNSAGIVVYNSNAPTLLAALIDYTKGKLSEATTANVEAHW